MDDWAGGPTPGAPPVPASLADLLAVAAEQRGLVTRRQCLQAGLSAKAVEVRLATRWARVHRGVFQTQPGRDDFWTLALAGQLACGPHAAWSHDTAAYRWGLLPSAPGCVELLVPTDFAVRSPAGCVVRRRGRLDTQVDPLRWPWLTTVPETLLDVADGSTVDGMFALLGRAFQRGLTDEDTLRRRLEARAKHHHRALLASVLADVGSGAESTMEVRYLRDVERAHGLPRGERQLSTEPGRRQRHDVGYREQKVLVELDGRLGHESRGDRVADGIRDRRSASTGWLTCRVFWHDVTVGVCLLAAEIVARAPQPRLARCTVPLPPPRVPGALSLNRLAVFFTPPRG